MFQDSETIDILLDWEDISRSFDEEDFGLGELYSITLCPPLIPLESKYIGLSAIMALSEVTFTDTSLLEPTDAFTSMVSRELAPIVILLVLG